jgi:hypothetical protein
LVLLIIILLLLGGYYWLTHPYIPSQEREVASEPLQPAPTATLTRELWRGTCVEEGQIAGANPVGCHIDMNLFRRELVPAELIGRVLDGWVNPRAQHEVVEYTTPFFRTCREFSWVNAGRPSEGTMVEIWVHIGYPVPSEVLRDGGDVLGWCTYCGNPRVLQPAEAEK